MKDLRHHLKRIQKKNIRLARSQNYVEKSLSVDIGSNRYEGFVDRK